MKHIKRFNESATENPLNYLKTEILDILQDSFLDNEIPVEVDLRQPAQVSVDKWDGNSNLHFTGQSESKKYTEKYAHIIIRFENMGWQTSHKLAYGDPITNQILQEYKFEDMNRMTRFISGAMGVFESQNHHPHYFNWSGSKLLISLKTHSSDGVTQKDWDVATELDNLI